jgi:hypothetical protein
VKSITNTPVVEATPHDLLVLVRKGYREAAIALTMKLQSGVVTYALTVWRDLTDDESVMIDFHVSAYLEVCRELTKYWMRHSEWRRALMCVSRAILCAKHDRIGSYTDRLRHAAICFELGWYDRTVDLTHELLEDAGDRLTGQSRLYLRILKCQSWQEAGNAAAARSYYNDTMQFVADERLPTPEWRPHGYRISHFDARVSAPGQTRAAT